MTYLGRSARWRVLRGFASSFCVRATFGSTSITRLRTSPSPPEGATHALRTHQTPPRTIRCNLTRPRSCLAGALGDKGGCNRMGVGEGEGFGGAQVEVVMDLSNRPHFEHDLEFDQVIATE